jgi:cation diffusion facilitator CzcD-associated flavoprotein CzcO
MKADFQVGIIGAGFGGLVAALRFQKEGRNSFVIFERASEVGGTWRDNVYPGCACDVPSHLYSFADELNPNWSRAFSKQPEILEYIKDVAEKHNLRKLIRFKTDIVDLKFIEEPGLWEITDQHGTITRVKLVISATGPLNRPNTPKFKGMELFQGKVFHSAEWDNNYDLKGKRVAVIGTGASSIQIVPNIAPIVGQLTVFQRTAAWVQMRPDHAFSGFAKGLFKTAPAINKFYREMIYWRNEFFGKAFVGNETINRIGSKLSLRHLSKQVRDPETRRKLTPNYKMGCKRVLVSNDYYPAFNRPNVTLETTSIQEWNAKGIITADGIQHDFDAIVLATGFVAAEIELYTTITGLNNRDLLSEWRQTGAQAYRGTTVSGFPNLAFILGPNTGLGHNSVVHMMESQMNYLIDYLKLLENHGPNGYLDVNADIQAKHNQHLQTQFEGTVWQSGCQSWYLNREGKNTTLYPRLTAQFRKELKHLDEGAYEVVVG